MPEHLKTDQALYLVSVDYRGRHILVNVVCCINSFDEAGELACQKASESEILPLDELSPVEISMSLHPLIVED